MKTVLLLLDYYRVEGGGGGINYVWDTAKLFLTGLVSALLFYGVFFLQKDYEKFKDSFTNFVTLQFFLELTESHVSQCEIALEHFKKLFEDFHNNPYKDIKIRLFGFADLVLLNTIDKNEVYKGFTFLHGSTKIATDYHTSILKHILNLEEVYKRTFEKIKTDNKVIEELKIKHNDFVAKICAEIIAMSSTGMVNPIVKKAVEDLHEIYYNYDLSQSDTIKLSRLENDILNLVDPAFRVTANNIESKYIFKLGGVVMDTFKLRYEIINKGQKLAEYIDEEIEFIENSIANAQPRIMENKMIIEDENIESNYFKYKWQQRQNKKKRQNDK
jgi:hypothetical protein